MQYHTARNGAMLYRYSRLWIALDWTGPSPPHGLLWGLEKGRVSGHEKEAVELVLVLEVWWV